MIPLYIPAALAQPNLVWISLDTTRADALSCYGDPPVVHRSGVRTPHLDALAARGVRFEHFYAQSPSTLASHATMFTGRDPHQTGVVRNGYPLEGLPTLAERLQTAGYQTHAVIGAAALERGMGIERGFDIYDDSSESLRGLMYQSPATEVVDRALAVEADKPLFLFVHFFDPHAPYEPVDAQRWMPKGYSGPFTDPELKVRRLLTTPPGPDHAAVDGRYLGELAQLDTQVQRLLDGLTERGLLDEALVVVVGDHGEALSDDLVYAWTHGNSLSDGVMQVPLLLEAHGLPLRRGTVQRTAAMQGLAPTVETLLGLEPTLGQDFAHLLAPGPLHDVEGWPEHPTQPVFMEATRPRTQESKTGWNNLPLRRKLRVGTWTLEHYPAMEHAEVDPLSPVLTQMLHAWDQDVPAHQRADMPPHTVRALKALGYLDP